MKIEIHAICVDVNGDHDNGGDDVNDGVDGVDGDGGDVGW